MGTEIEVGQVWKERVSGRRVRVVRLPHPSLSQKVWVENVVTGRHSGIQTRNLVRHFDLSSETEGAST